MVLILLVEVNTNDNLLKLIISNVEENSLLNYVINSAMKLKLCSVYVQTLTTQTSAVWSLLFIPIQAMNSEVSSEQCYNVYLALMQHHGHCINIDQSLSKHGMFTMHQLTHGS